MTTDWCSLITDGELSGNGCLESVLNTLRYRAKNCTGMELFYVCIFLLAVHSYACFVYRFYERYHYDTYTEDYPRVSQLQLPIQACAPPQEDTPRQITFDSPPTAVSTSTAQSSTEGLCQREESSSDSEKEKPIWRPKLKRKRKKNNRQGW